MERRWWVYSQHTFPTSNPKVWMCKEFREMDEGMCHCGLYIKVQEEDIEHAED